MTSEIDAVVERLEQLAAKVEGITGRVLRDDLRALLSAFKVQRGALESVAGWPDAALGHRSCAEDMRKTARAALAGEAVDG